VGGTLGLALASANVDEEQEIIAARACTHVGEYVRRFSEMAHGTLCHEIIQTNFDSDWELRKYILTKSLGCVKLIAGATSVLIDILGRRAQSPSEQCFDLNREFTERRFHCAQSVFLQATDRMTANLTLPPHMLAPLDGGVGYSGSTCAALLGGCMVIGLARGGDTSRAGMLGTVRRMGLTLIHGSAAFNRLDLSPANDALLRCAELAKWFKGTFHSLQCREITGTDFGDEAGKREFFEHDGISRCVEIAEKTAIAAAELAER
jgi:hypothetical protein